MVTYIHNVCYEVSVVPRNKHPEETINKILDVAFKLFVEKGYEQTTVLDIVEGLGGMTRGAFYHHFKDKAAVFDAVGDRIFLENGPFAHLDKLTGMTGLQKIQWMMKQSILEPHPDAQAMNQMGLTLISDPHFLTMQIKSNVTVARDFLAPLFAEGMADGSIRPGNPVVLADLFMLTFNLWTFPTLFPCDQEEFVARLTTIAEIFENLGCPLIDEEMAAATNDIAALFSVEPAPAD